VGAAPRIERKSPSAYTTSPTCFAPIRKDTALVGPLYLGTRAGVQGRSETGKAVVAADGMVYITAAIGVAVQVSLVPDDHDEGEQYG
jgi:hypothetical protein